MKLRYFLSILLMLYLAPAWSQAQDAPAPAPAPEAAAPAPEAVKNVMRARILRSMLLCVAQRPAEASSEVNHHEV